MEDIFLSVEIDEDTLLCVSPLSAKTYRESGGKGLGGDRGYFLYEVDLSRQNSGISIIAKASGAEEAEQLFALVANGRSRRAA